ncbi:unnamed protein product, partial [Protopolystoma xenopodis]
MPARMKLSEPGIADPRVECAFNKTKLAFRPAQTTNTVSMTSTNREDVSPSRSPGLASCSTATCSLSSVLTSDSSEETDSAYDGPYATGFRSRSMPKGRVRLEKPSSTQALHDLLAKLLPAQPSLQLRLNIEQASTELGQSDALLDRLQLPSLGSHQPSSRTSRRCSVSTLEQASGLHTPRPGDELAEMGGKSPINIGRPAFCQGSLDVGAATTASGSCSTTIPASLSTLCPGHLYNSGSELSLIV